MIGSAVSAGPSAAVTAASAATAAPTPMNAERQLRVTPTASTIVSASTASTAQARNTETARPTSVPVISEASLGAGASRGCPWREAGEDMRQRRGSRPGSVLEEAPLDGGEVAALGSFDEA